MLLAIIPFPYIPLPVRQRILLLQEHRRKRRPSLEIPRNLYILLIHLCFYREHQTVFSLRPRQYCYMIKMAKWLQETKATVKREPHSRKRSLCPKMLDLLSKLPFLCVPHLFSTLQVFCCFRKHRIGFLFYFVFDMYYFVFVLIYFDISLVSRIQGLLFKTKLTKICIFHIFRVILLGISLGRLSV